MATGTTDPIEDVARAVHDMAGAVVGVAEDVGDLRERLSVLERAPNGAGEPGGGVRAEDTGRGPVRARAEDLLTRGQSLQTWAREHASEGLDTGADRTFRLGAVIAAAAGGHRTDLHALELRALEGGIGEAGGFMLAPEIGAMLIDRARNAARVIQAGAVTLPMSASEVYLPRLDTGVTGSWRPEGATISAETPAFGRITLKARTLAALVVISQELLDDLSPQGLGMIENELVQALALKLDYAALRGAGAESEPMGIANTTGVASEELGANGALPVDWDWALSAIGDVEGANGEPAAAIYSARTATSLRKMKTGLTGDKTPLTMPARVAELRHLVTNQIPDDLTWGSSDVTSEAFVGDFSQVVIGTRLGLRLRMLTERYAENLQVALQVFLRADVGVAHPEHLCVVHGFKES